MEIKLIALDLDGTTLGKGAVLTDETKYTLEAAIERGGPCGDSHRKDFQRRAGKSLCHKRA